MGSRPPMPQGEYGRGPQAGGPRFYNETRVYRERPQYDDENRDRAETGPRPPMPTRERRPQAGGPRFSDAPHDRFYYETRVHRERPSHDNTDRGPGAPGPRPPMPQGDRFAYQMRPPSNPPFHRDDRYTNSGSNDMARPSARDERRFDPGDGRREFRGPPMRPEQFGAPGPRDDRREFDGSMDRRPRFENAPSPHWAPFRRDESYSAGDARPDHSHGHPPGPPPPPFQ
jgi:hypothetical protein